MSRWTLTTSIVSLAALGLAIALSSSITQLRPEPLAAALLLLAFGPWLYKLGGFFRRAPASKDVQAPPASPPTLTDEDLTDDQVRLKVKFTILKISNASLADWDDSLADQTAERMRWMAAQKDTFKWIAAFSAAGLFGVAQLARSEPRGQEITMAFALGMFFVSLISGVLYTTRVDLRTVADGYRAIRLLRNGARLHRQSSLWADLMLSHWDDRPDDRHDYVVEYRKLVAALNDYIKERQSADYLVPEVRLLNEGYWLSNLCATAFIGGASYVLLYALVTLWIP